MFKPARPHLTRTVILVFFASLMATFTLKIKMIYQFFLKYCKNTEISWAKRQCQVLRMQKISRHNKIVSLESKTETTKD